jgi:hypothetical protein
MQGSAQGAQTGHNAPEVDIALPRIAPAVFVEETTICCADPPAPPLDVRHEDRSCSGWGELPLIQRLKGSGRPALRQGSDPAMSGTR